MEKMFRKIFSQLNCLLLYGKKHVFSPNFVRKIETKMALNNIGMQLLRKFHRLFTKNRDNLSFALVTRRTNRVERDKNCKIDIIYNKNRKIVCHKSCNNFNQFCYRMSVCLPFLLRLRISPFVSFSLLFFLPPSTITKLF